MARQASSPSIREVSDKEAACVLHALSETVEESICRRMGGTAIVHIDPINREHPQYGDIARTIKEIISGDERVDSFHELRIIGSAVNKCKVVFDIALEKDVDEQETFDIIRSVQERFESRFPDMKAVIIAEPKFTYNL